MAARQRATSTANHSHNGAAKRSSPRRKALAPAPAAGDYDPRLSTAVALVPALAQTLGGSCEVVVHDLSKAPNSIVAIAGTLTGRRVGGPMTDLLLSVLSRGETEDLINYRTETAGGRTMRSSTIFIKDDDGAPIGCLCVNIDVSVWSDLADLISWQLGSTVGAADGVERGSKMGRNGSAAGDGLHPHVPADLGPRSGQLEAFPSDMQGLREALVARAIDEVGVPLHLMQKQHKMQVVRALDVDGFFLIKESVGYVARALNVTRYSIYNYLNEVRDTAADGRPTPIAAKSARRRR